VTLSFIIRPIEARDDVRVQQIIEQGGREFSAIGEGFGPSDPEVAAMSQHYQAANSAYYVLEAQQQVWGCAGIAEFDAATATCELRKLFVSPQARGQGYGRALAEHCLKQAQALGYQQCYLDTLSTMKQAIGLYQDLGFEHLTTPFAASEHSGCDVWMLKRFTRRSRLSTS